MTNNENFLKIEKNGINGQPIHVRELTTNIEFSSVTHAAKYFNISLAELSLLIKKSKDLIVEYKGYKFKRVNYEYVEEYTGKVFKTTVEAAVFFDINSASISNSITRNKSFTPIKGKNRGKKLKFIRRNIEDGNDFLNNLLNKQIINVNTSEVMTVEAAAKKYNVAPYKINECISFGHAISYNNSKIYFKNLEINKEKIIFSEKDKIVHKDIKRNESFNILTNKSGQVIIIKDDKIIKRFETAEDLLNYFDKKEIEINLEKEKIICHI